MTVPTRFPPTLIGPRSPGSPFSTGVGNPLRFGPECPWFRELLANALWYQCCQDAVSYAKLLGSDSSGEIRVLIRDGGAESVSVLLCSVPGES
jgi:hypothetical protein